MIGTWPGNRGGCFRQTSGQRFAAGVSAMGRAPASVLRLLTAALLMVFLAAIIMPAQAARITGLSAAAQGNDADVIVELDGSFAAPHMFYLDGPQRIVIDFPGTRLAGPNRAEGSGPVKSVRLAQNTPEMSRLVIDLADGAVASVDPSGVPGRNALRLSVRSDRQGFASALRQGRRTLDIAAPTGPASAQTAPGQTAPVQTASVSPQVQAAVAAAAQKAQAQAQAQAQTQVPVQTAAAAPVPTPVAAQPPAAAPSGPVAPVRPGALPVVVIDAGHGGQDPGAPSIIKGRWEKEVTLAIAKAIKEELDRSGKVKAVLTRSTDIFIPLGRRVDIARAAGANLFISIHADSIGRPDVHGATVYTLSETASDKEAERLAAKENKADVIAGINLGAESQDVTNILIDLVQRETMNLSAEFAGIMVREVGKHRYFRSNNHRFAGFRVLKAPDVPSVLLETGYMSNLEDSKYLFSEAGQKAIARGVRAAVESYFQRTLARASVAAGAP